MAVIHAIYENGILRPTDPLDLPEATEVEVELRRVTRPTPRPLEGVYAVLRQRFESGETDVAARHDEHLS